LGGELAGKPLANFRKVIDNQLVLAAYILNDQPARINRCAYHKEIINQCRVA